MRGELSAGLVTDCFYIQGWMGRGQTRPDKPFEINRVPVNANNCSGLASRMKKPATSAGVSVWRMLRRLCHARKPSCATR